MKENIYNAGLVLEGGGMRGFFTMGVLDFFMDNNIMFKNIYGVSAGACHACSYISGQRGRALDMNTTYLSDKRYASLYSLIKTGDYFEKDFQLNVIPNQLNIYDYEAYKNAGVNFYATTTNCETGEAEYLQIKDMKTEIDMLWASSTLPLLSRMVKIGGKNYLDGGIADSIPVNYAIKDGNARVVVVLTRDLNYRKKLNNLMPVIRIKYKKYPKLINAIENRHKVYNKTIAYIRKLEEDGKIIVIRPLQKVALGRLEKNEQKLRELYKQGYEEAKKKLESLKEYLQV